MEFESVTCTVAQDLSRIFETDKVISAEAEKKSRMNKLMLRNSMMCSGYDSDKYPDVSGHSLTGTYSFS